MAWLTRSRGSSFSTPQQDEAASSSSSSVQGTPVRDRQRQGQQRSTMPHQASAGMKATRGGAGHAHAHAHRAPSSPTLSAVSGMTGVTRASKLDFGAGIDGPAVIITRANMRDSLDTYENLLKAAKAYRNAMLALATATSDFASALEDCARQKGAAYTPQPSSSSKSHHPVFGIPEDLPGLDGESASHPNDGNDAAAAAAAEEAESGPTTSPSERLMAAAGLHHVMSNQQQLLSDTFYKSFEIPLLEKYDHYRAEVQERQMQYEQETSEKSRKIRETEAENMKVGRKKQRDLTSFRRALLLLQSQVDDLDRIKADFYQEVLEGEEENWNTIAGKVALIVRSQIDAADRIVTKGTSDSIIESMVQTILDPFNAYGQPSEEGHIFSILPPLGITSPASSNASPQHPATGLARSKFTHANSSSSVLESQSSSSPATTARWAQDQQKQQQRLANGGRQYSATSTSAGTEEDADMTPKRERKDRLSWISENNEEQRDTIQHSTGGGGSGAVNDHLLGRRSSSSSGSRHAEVNGEEDRLLQTSSIAPLASEDNGW